MCKIVVLILNYLTSSIGVVASTTSCDQSAVQYSRLIQIALKANLPLLKGPTSKQDMLDQKTIKHKCPDSIYFTQILLCFGGKITPRRVPRRVWLNRVSLNYVVYSLHCTITVNISLSI